MSNAIDFLAHVAEKTIYSHLFQDKGTLETICSSIILPNIQLRGADEELFEDNPEEYIRQDLEGTMERLLIYSCTLVLSDLWIITITLILTTTVLYSNT